MALWLMALLARYDRVIDGTHASGRTGYQRAAKNNIVYTHNYQLALFLHYYPK